METGAATRDRDPWIYRSTTSPADAAAVMIEVTAQTRAGAKIAAVYSTS